MDDIVRIVASIILIMLELAFIVCVAIDRIQKATSTIMIIGLCSGFTLIAIFLAIMIIIYIQML